MNNVLNCFVVVAPYINELTSTDFSISVCDLQKCVIYVPGKRHDHKIESGTPHVKGSVAYETIISNEKTVRKVEADIFGFPYIAIGVPIFDNKDSVIGSVVFTEATDKQDLLLNLAQNLHETMQQMLSITEIISKNSLNLNNVSEELRLVTDDSMKGVEDTNNILAFIKKISDNTNILGLNASIEAARIGQAGGGFTVVAEEIRNLAKVTNEYVVNANKVIAGLKNSTNKVKQRLDELLYISTHQMDINRDINRMVKDISEMASELRKEAQLLVK